ncbi:hypothetical protein R6Q59_031410 [Mikania micrantha]
MTTVARYMKVRVEMKLSEVRRSGQIAEHVLTMFSNTVDKHILVDNEECSELRLASTRSISCQEEAKERCVNLLKDNQKKSVVKMGFWSLLNFMVDAIPRRSAHYVIDKFDDKKMVIRGRRFEQITPLDVLDKKVKECREQNEDRFVGASSSSSLVDNIQHLEDKEDFNFRLNFVMMFVIVLVECTKNGRMKEDILKYLYHGTDFSQFDWCDFIIEKTKGCKSGWMPYDSRSPSNGPLTILTIGADTHCGARI